MRTTLSWGIRCVACAAVLLAILWIVIMLSAGQMMGFSDRGPLQIAAFLLFALVLPAVAVGFLANKAIAASRAGRLKRAAIWMLLAFVPIPLVYIVEGMLMLAGAPPL